MRAHRHGTSLHMWYFFEDKVLYTYMVLLYGYSMYLHLWYLFYCHVISVHIWYFFMDNVCHYIYVVVIYRHISSLDMSYLLSDIITLQI